MTDVITFAPGIQGVPNGVQASTDIHNSNTLCTYAVNLEALQQADPRQSDRIPGFGRQFRIGSDQTHSLRMQNNVLVFTQRHVEVSIRWSWPRRPLVLRNTKDEHFPIVIATAK